MTSKGLAFVCLLLMGCSGSAQNTRTLRCLFIACVILFSTHCHAAIDTIVPLPKEIRAVGKPIPLDDFGIAAAGDERSQIGAAEINQRIVSLGGQPLPVSRLDGRLPEGKWIVVAPCTAKELAALTPPLEVTPDQPGPQGYAIRPTRSDDDLKLLLVGSDSLGTLYAAVTCRQLIVDGQLASERCLDSAKSPNDRPLTMKPLPFPVQVGLMNTGYRPADASIDELRISSVRRYSDSFVPAKHSETDEATLALFHFDGDLGAETPAGCQAAAGPVQ